MDPLKTISSIAASGMHAQGQRLKVVSENVANAGSLSAEPGGDPYRRKTISFQEMVGEAGESRVDVAEIARDSSDFQLVYDPIHPAANEQGYVKTSNVNPILEMSNMREASRSYEANLNMLEAGRQMRNRLLDMLK
ncbi:flagellar basal body rod protein FlgC [Brevirhabdus pacifica]|uniref:Flagellar basal-body rod protein FlgC n=1 Tax=Brevirhabdus pacifica TaxID=1267768 RepID=A0A1U7DH11_9RHOB|nr:flagellar basal body rod protein FlgC [Brevirhabdus pacifica]APX89189.1 flagellar basal body rod protein FlgC [Brevirhabdus pacifica]OWU76759.1 flagellar basal-body rod protein FlgC [Loktanella sp. 22II-4b]PJJ86211.1 flagellar basal-body rod protein FlgC [Brevirhabdus pacifica]